MNVTVDLSKLLPQQKLGKDMISLSEELYDIIIRHVIMGASVRTRAEGKRTESL